jgi:hypothetical protein
MHLKKALIDTELSAYIPSALNFYMLFFKTYIVHPIGQPISNYIEQPSFLAIYLMEALWLFFLCIFPKIALNIRLVTVSRNMCTVFCFGLTI